MRPRTNPSLPPLLHEIGEYNFQELCRDLLEVQDGIATCEIFGTRGQSQRGVDLLAARRDGDGNEVAQCKCHQDISPQQIAKASDDFIDHLDYWTARKVKRFVLIVACPLSRTQQAEAILAQQARFGQRGIIYEAWSASTLRQKLCPHRAIAERYILSRDIVDNICGHVPANLGTPAVTSPHLLTALDAAGSQIAQLSSALSQEKAARLEEARSMNRCGKRTAGYTLADSMRKDPTWNLLDKPLRAKVLRLLAGCVLDREGDVDRARALALDASTLDPSADDSIIQAAIRYHELGPRAAFDSLPEPTNVDALNYRIGLLLEMGELDLLLATVDSTSIAGNAETLRIHALGTLLRKDVIGARKLVEQALSDQANWESVRIAAGIIEYYSTVPTAVIPDQLYSVPLPVSWEFIKRDDESLACLRNAAARFENLAANTQRPIDQCRTLGIWQLACLASDPSRQMEASALCRRLLISDPTDGRVLMWAVARGYDIGLPSIEQSIRARLAETPADPEIYSALVGTCLSQRKAGEALEILASNKELYSDAQLRDRWLSWRVQALIAVRDFLEAAKTIEDISVASLHRTLQQMLLQARFEQNGDWEDLLSCIESSFAETGDPRLFYDACSLKARLEDWSYVSERAARLVSVSKSLLAASFKDRPSRIEADFRAVASGTEGFGVLVRGSRTTEQRAGRA